MQYKIQQDTERLKQLDAQVEKKEARLGKLDEQITVKEKAKATIAEVNAMGKPALLGGVNFTDDEAKKLKSLAKKGVGVDKRAEDYKKKITTLEGDIRTQLKTNSCNNSENNTKIPLSKLAKTLERGIFHCQYLSHQSEVIRTNALNYKANPLCYSIKICFS